MQIYGVDDYDLEDMYLLRLDIPCRGVAMERGCYWQQPLREDTDEDT